MKALILDFIANLLWQIVFFVDWMLSEFKHKFAGMVVGIITTVLVMRVLL